MVFTYACVRANVVHVYKRIREKFQFRRIVEGRGGGGRTFKQPNGNERADSIPVGTKKRTGRNLQSRYSIGQRDRVVPPYPVRKQYYLKYRVRRTKAGGNGERTDFVSARYIQEEIGSERSKDRSPHTPPPLLLYDNSYDIYERPL